MRILRDLAIAVAAGAIVYVIFDFAANAPLAIRVGVALAVTAVSLGVAMFARRRSTTSAPSGTRVADKIRAKRDVSVSVQLVGGT
jgi:uncharacterized membrane protein